MKIAFYSEDGLEQLVLTPQTEVEQRMLDKLHDAERSVEIKRGSFYECQGGWMRHKIFYEPSRYGSDPSDSSTIVVLRPRPPNKTD